MPESSQTRSLQVCEAFSNKRCRSSSSSAIRAMRRQGAFDPERHEVVGVVEQPDSAPGTVVEVLRPGYGEGSRQLRPAAVVVSRREE